MGSITGRLWNAREQVCGWCMESEPSKDFAELADMVRKMHTYTYRGHTVLHLPDETFLENGDQHEDFISAVMLLIPPRKHTHYATLPPWFPKCPCEKCGAELLAYVWQLTDLYLLDFNLRELERSIDDVKRSNHYDRDTFDYPSWWPENHGPDPYASGECSPVSVERLFGHSQG